MAAGAAALVAAQSVQADPLPVPVPKVAVPQLPVLPQVTSPALPQVSLPAPPPVAVPSLPPVSVPAVPQVTISPRPNAPAPTRAPQVAVAQRPRTQSHVAAVTPTGNPAASDPTRGSSETSAGARTPARRTREPSSTRLRRLLEPLAACVGTLGPLQETVIVLRAGLRGHAGQTRTELASTLGTSRTRVTRLERRALRTLRRTVRAGGCASPGPSAAAVETVEVVQVSSPIESGSHPDRQEVKGVTESESRSVVPRVATAGRQAGAAIPKAAAALTEPARSYADDHPIMFALAVLVTAFCAVLLVRELRRGV